MAHSTFSLLILAVLISPSLQSTINIWPKPQVFFWTQPQAIFLSPNFTVKFLNDHKYLKTAAWRHTWQLKNERHRPLVIPDVNITSAPPLDTLEIHVTNLHAPLHHGVNESYTLSVPASGGTAVIMGETAWGVMRGLESLSQLAWGDPVRVAAGVYISDWPNFPHRGLMLDTSRNYFGVKDILKTIRTMGANKLNVFHWHITDAQSFPVELALEPCLAEKGSYGPDMRYSAEDVKEVVEFGLEHGVRVIPEIDMPGHTGSWAEAHPEIVTCADMFWWPAGSDWSGRLAAEPGTGHLNPLNPKTYEIVKNVINDITSMFPEPFYHGGADEIIPNCWKADPMVQKHLESERTLSELLDLFMNTTIPYILSHNRTAVYWEDVLLDPEIHVSPSTLPQEYTILQTWSNGTKNTKRIVQAGYRAIISSAEFYYLDCGHGDFVGNKSLYNKPPGTDPKDGGSWCEPFKTWQTIYNYDITYGLTEAEAKLVLGGEVVLWTEQTDPTVLDARIWPRASAFSEAMWSGNKDETGMKRYAEATDRLNEWRYRMVTRGVGAEPIQPLWCARNPGMCSTFH